MHRFLAMVAGGAILAGATAVAAADCTEAVDRFAQDAGLTAAMPERPGEHSAGPTTAPATSEARGGIAPTDRLAESGGVIRPPDTGAPAAITPPPTPDSMPTAPQIRPGTPGGGAAARSSEVDAATQAQAEAMLFAAKAAAEEGKEEQCFERLQQAKKLVGGEGR